MKSDYDLLIAICSHRAVTAPTCHSLDLLRLAYQDHSIHVKYQLGLFAGDALICRSRSQACTKFLEQTKIPYMLFIDDDIIFQPQDVVKIYESLRVGSDVIGGIYPVRGASQLSSYGFGGQLDVDGQIREIEYLATGFMGISRKILEKIKNEVVWYYKGEKQVGLPLLNPNDWSRCYPFFEAKAVLPEDRANGKGDPIYISEDWDFCSKARQCGAKILVDTSVQLGHLREEVFTPDSVKNNQYQAIVQKQTYGAIQHQSELMMSIDTDLSEFLKIPIPEAQRRMLAAQQNLARLWREKPGSSEDFYKDNETYLFDLATFNKDHSYWESRFSQLLNIHGNKILDIGCGIGSTVFTLAEQGNDVVGWDINQKAIAFCNFKKKKYNIGGTFTIDKPDFGEFDLIVAIDVLEHIENLEGFIKDLSSKMKYGAKLYHSDYFPRGEHNAWPMHFEENASKLEDILTRNGLVSWDERWTIKGG